MAIKVILTALLLTVASTGSAPLVSSSLNFDLGEGSLSLNKNLNLGGSKGDAYASVKSTSHGTASAGFLNVPAPSYLMPNIVQVGQKNGYNTKPTNEGNGVNFEIQKSIELDPALLKQIGGYNTQNYIPTKGNYYLINNGQPNNGQYNGQYLPNNRQYLLNNKQYNGQYLPNNGQFIQVGQAGGYPIGPFYDEHHNYAYDKAVIVDYRPILVSGNSGSQPQVNGQTGENRVLVSGNSGSQPQVNGQSGENHVQSGENDVKNENNKKNVHIQPGFENVSSGNLAGIGEQNKLDNLNMVSPVVKEPTVNGESDDPKIPITPTLRQLLAELTKCADEDEENSEKLIKTENTTSVQSVTSALVINTTPRVSAASSLKNSVRQVVSNHKVNKENIINQQSPQYQKVVRKSL